MAFDQAYSRHLNSKNKEEAEPKKKLKKKRSIRFSSGSWLRLSSKSKFNETEAALVQQPNMTASSDSTKHEEIECDDVNSMVTSSSGSSADMVARRQSSHDEIECDDVSSMVSSSCGSSDMVAVASTAMSDYTGVSRIPSSSEISNDSSDNNNNNSEKSCSKSVYLSRSSSKRAVKVLIKKTGSNARKDHALDNSKMSDNAHVERGTCSSIIKDTRFPEHVELEAAGQAVSEGTTLVKVCPYHHCSLNGHCHDPPIEKKPFLRRRRQSLEPPKIDKAMSVSGPESKPSAGVKKGSNSKKKHQVGPISDGRSGSNMVVDSQSVSDKSSYQEFHEEVKDSSSLELKNTTKAPALSLGSEKPKPMSMWHLIHRHMVSDRAAEEESKKHQEADQNNQAGEDELSPSNAVPDLSDSEIGDSNQEVEVRKLLAIKLVREAIEKILLPEVQSESQSVTSDNVEELTEKKRQEDPDEGCKDESTTKQVDVDGSIIPKETKKSGKKSLSNWSNLKKWVLLQKFVKELEKVRKLNYRKPRQLHLEAEQSAEKINLRHQGGDEKKKAEEWMLDYALQQVVSELAPTQRRKVALLVKAFETVVPPQEDGVLQMPAILQENRWLKTHNLAPKPDKSESLQSEKPRNAASMDATLSMSEGKLDVKETETKTENVGRGSESSRRNEDVIVAESCNTEEKSEAGEDSESLSIDSTEKIEPRPNSEHESAPSTDEICKVGDVNLVRSTSELGKSESLPVAGVGDANLVRSTSEMGKSESIPVAGVIRENYLNMWHSVCQHVVSSVATKLVLDGNEVDTEEENKLAFNQTPRGSIHEAEFSRSQVLKLVKEAVQEILSPEIRDESSSDTLPTSGHPDQDGGAKKNTGEPDKGRDGSSQGEEKEQESKNIEPVLRSSSDPPKAKNWRKLKKLLLLRRSINAMEEARKLKFRTQQLLPLPCDREPEKVDLRPQMVEERRKAEQWMLDYAVQNMVTQLTPARKKRVAMLVEAFEAVIPLPEM